MVQGKPLHGHDRGRIAVVPSVKGVDGLRRVDNPHADVFTVRSHAVLASILWRMRTSYEQGAIFCQAPG